MPIDESDVKWDSSAPTDTIHPDKIKWDDEPTESQKIIAAPAHKIGDSLVDNLHQVGSGMYHSAVAGYRGMYDLATHQGVDQATDDINDELQKTYQAPDSLVKSALQSKYNPMNYAQEGADYLADQSADAGLSPWVSTAIKAAPTALAAMTGVAGLARNPSLAIGKGLINKPNAVRAPIVNPEDAVANAAADQSMGAAAVKPDISDADPLLKDELSKTPHPNLQVLERHLDTQRLPLPEGETPIRLRKGQATNDSQQRSDEKNLRADPDTQGLLTQSIEDQDAKLGLSMGEIQRRANPNIVQRTNTDHDQAAIDAIKAQDNDTVKDIRAKYQALADANGGDMPIDTAATLKNINAELKREGLHKLVNDHSVLSSITDGLGSDTPIDFAQFERWRTRLAEVQRRGGSEATAAGIIHHALNEMPLTPEASPLRDLADTARAAAKARFDTIKRNPAYKAAINDNVDKTADGLHDLDEKSPLAGHFLHQFATGSAKTASPEYVARLKSAVSHPDLHDAIEAATLNNLRDSAGINTKGEGLFKNKKFADAVDDLEPKASVLLKPETIDNIQHLKRVSGYVNNESKAESTNRSNTMVTLGRFGAIQPKVPSVAGKLLEIGSDAAIGHTGPAAPAIGLVKGIGQQIFSKAQKAKEEQSLRDAKLKFAQDAVKPGAGLDYQPPRPLRARGGKTGPTDDELLSRLMARWRAAKKAAAVSSKPLLSVPDSAIAAALKHAGDAL